MSTIAVPILIAIIGIIWSAYSLKLSNREFVRRKKAEIYQLMISSSIELREAYFEGTPTRSYIRPPPLAGSRMVMIGSIRTTGKKPIDMSKGQRR